MPATRSGFVGELLRAKDCESGVCDATTGKCLAATCSDAVKNGDETDVDCGGVTCQKCADTKGCQKGGDCQSGVCDNGKCQAPTCTDKVKNGSETDVDGGGTCPACATGKVCKTSTDCKPGICASGTCRVGASCKEILAAHKGSLTGTCTIDPDGSGAVYKAFAVHCDMTSAGGGWTGITTTLAKNNFVSKLTGWDKLGKYCNFAGKTYLGLGQCATKADWGTKGKVVSWDNKKTTVAADSTLRLEFTESCGGEGWQWAGGTVYVR